MCTDKKRLAWHHAVKYSLSKIPGTTASNLTVTRFHP